MTLTRGSFRSYEFDRNVILFSMVDGQREVPCAVSTLAMDGMESPASIRPNEREAQFMLGVRRSECNRSTARFACLRHRPRWTPRSPFCVVCSMGEPSLGSAACCLGI